MPNIKGPDGKVISFPAGTSDADIAAAFSQSPAPNSAPQKGFFSSLSDSIGASGIAHLITHPVEDTTDDKIKQFGRGVISSLGENVSQAGQAAKSLVHGNVGDAVGHAAFAVPILGQAMNTAADQVANNGQAPTGKSYLGDLKQVVTTPGAMGTLTGAAAGMVAPEMIPKAARAGINTGVAAVRGAGKVAQVVASDAPSLSLAATRTLTHGTPGELLQAALKPGVKYGAGVGAKLEASLPDVLAADPAMKGVGGYAKAADTARDTAFQPYNDLTAPYRPPAALDPSGQITPAVGPYRPSAIDGNPIANAQMQSIPAMNRFEDVPTAPTMRPNTAVPSKGATPPIRFAPQPEGGIVADTAKVADLYRKPLSVPILDDIRGDANAKLNAFYNKAGGDQAAALSNPETARVKAVGDSTRSVLYPTLESDAGLAPGSVDAMQAKYGGLVDASDIANKREPVFERHDPITLPQTIALGHGGPFDKAFNFATSKLFRTLTDSDALVNSAVDRFRNPEGTPLIPRLGFGPQASMRAGSALAKVPYVPPVPSFGAYKPVLPLLTRRPSDGR